MPVLRWLCWSDLLSGPPGVWSTIKLMKQRDNNTLLGCNSFEHLLTAELVLSAFQTMTNNVGE